MSLSFRKINRHLNSTIQLLAEFPTLFPDLVFSKSTTLNPVVRFGHFEGCDDVHFRKLQLKGLMSAMIQTVYGR